MRTVTYSRGCRTTRSSLSAASARASVLTCAVALTRPFACRCDRASAASTSPPRRPQPYTRGGSTASVPATDEGRPAMAGFVQIIEWKTSRIDEVEKLSDDFRGRMAERGGGPTRVTVVADRDRTNTYLTIAEFASLEEAEK